MNAADADRIIHDLGLDDRVEGIVEMAPPMSDTAVEVWRSAVDFVIGTEGAAEK